jgi:DNA-binding NarL/FixJ family response regulator
LAKPGGISMPSLKIITVLVADDHPLAREGVRSILDQAPDIKVVGEVQDGKDIKLLVAKLRPNILLLDMKMPNPSPVELEKWVRENYPETITLVLTSHDRDSYLAGMMDAGVAGYLDKNSKGMI